MNLLDLARSALAAAPAAPAWRPDVPARRWQIRIAGRDPMEVMITPGATHAEVAAIYPGARIEPLPDRLRRKATAAEAEELRPLVAVILGDADETDREEPLTVALADPEAALTSFRALAADLQPHPLPDYDDRRACEECANLDRHRGRDGFRRCAAAQRGERIGNAGRDYSPFPDVPRRCEGYLPFPDDPDRRPGRERWPMPFTEASV